MTHEEFFKDYGNVKIKCNKYDTGGSFVIQTPELSIEEMYQMFKARMLSEIAIDDLEGAGKDENMILVGPE